MVFSHVKNEHISCSVSEFEPEPIPEAFLLMAASFGLGMDFSLSISILVMIFFLFSAMTLGNFWLYVQREKFVPEDDKNDEDSTYLEAIQGKANSQFLESQESLNPFINFIKSYYSKSQAR